MSGRLLQLIAFELFQQETKLLHINSQGMLTHQVSHFSIRLSQATMNLPTIHGCSGLGFAVSIPAP